MLPRTSSGKFFSSRRLGPTTVSYTHLDVYKRQQWVLVIQGVIFVVCVLLFRRGIVGELAAVLRVQL